MTTITINTYDPEGRFDMDAAQAKEFFSLVAKKAEEAGHDVAFVESVQVDELSEEFVSQVFESL